MLECHDGRLQIIVEDNGKGFDPDAPVMAGHLGLAGIRERLALIDGVLIIDSAPMPARRSTPESPSPKPTGGCLRREHR
ncbi:MAG: hypothetical protein JO255_14055 [Alphaproteobacteria bacterium]|nr:hypothetical protein [Alphaproteobacteria bacterium]